MKKYILSTIAGTITFVLIFIIFASIEGLLTNNIELYNDPMFHDIKALKTILLIILTKVVTSFIMTYLHEKLSRCNSSLFEKTWRFAGLAYALIYIPGLLMTYATMTLNTNLIISWLISGYLQTFAASAAIIYTCYKFPADNLNCSLKK